MDFQKYFAILNELHSNCSQLKEAQDLNRSMALLQCDNIDIELYNSANSFIESILNKYPTLKYYIDKHRDGRRGNPDFKTMSDYLVIASMCIITELYVETHKNV